MDITEETAPSIRSLLSEIQPEKTSDPLRQDVEIEMKFVLTILVVLLIVAHQASRWWDGGGLVFGFLPRLLLYHMGVSIAAASVWFWATRYVWPDELESSARDCPSEQEHA